MDPNPNNFPILSYVMSKLPSMTPRRAAAEFDVEQPPPSSPSSGPHFELTERMPHLTDPEIVASMRSAVAQVAQTRSVLRSLGERPDHESVDNAKAKLVEIEDRLSKQMEEVPLSSGSSSDVGRGVGQGDSSSRKSVEDEIQMYKAVISLDEMHGAYEKMLAEAEMKLEKIYEMAVAGDGDAVPAVAEAEDPVEVNEEVVAILQESSGKEIERIDLSGKKLRFLPEAFGQIPGLLKLDLSRNHLEVIPDSIAGLKELEELNLSANLLESLPESIGLLTNLKILNVSGNKLIALPDSICHCSSLVELDASFNKLTYLPTNIGYELVNLKKLSIFLNKIRSLPTSIGEMKSLCILDGHFNELHGLPITIGKLASLESLNLSGNFSDLTELPETFGDLLNLKELDLSNNQIHALPNTFGQLDNLTKLNVDQNPLVIPPNEVVSKGVEAVKHFMAMRWLDILMEEERRSTLEAQDQSPTSLLTRSTSWLTNAVSNFSRSASGYLGYAGKSNADPYLDQQL